VNVLLLNQYFYPDVASTAQHAADLARRLAERGHSVTALAGRRSYADPGRAFSGEEWWEGVRILRVAQTGFGKGARWRRAADFGSFYAACACRLLALERFDAVVAMTTPPLISMLAACYARLRSARLYLWVMDLNPDQAVAAGWLRQGAAVHRLLERALRVSLEQAEGIVVLDRFMKQRVVERGVRPDKITVLPPWTHDEAVRFDPAGRERFRREHGLDGKYVVMYSGNHSPCHPLDTLLEAARILEERPEIAFCFVGGGSEFERVRRSGLSNVVCLPYQPLGRLSASLSAADLHVVVMGDPFVGIVHPCKVYNILRLGIPFLYIGPAESHIADLAPARAAGSWAHLFRHGDARGVAQCIASCADAGQRRFQEETRVAEQFSRQALLDRMLQLIGCGTQEEVKTWAATI